MGALQDLIKVIETIRERIKAHGDSVQKNETRTRQVLIDPLLAALGWDVTDPAQVTLEYASGNGRADYALLGPGRPVAVVEAKRLEQQLDAKHSMQVLNYANEQGIKYMVVTNGDEWKMYDVFKHAPLTERVLMSLKISANPPHESAIQSLRLWNPNLASDSQPMAPVEPILISPQPEPEPKPEPKTEPEPKPTPPDERLWLALNDSRLQPAWQATEGRGKRRISVRFNGGAPIPFSVWANVIKETVDSLLVKPGLLTPAHCPRYLGSSKKRYFLNTSPVHADGIPFANHRELSNGMSLNLTLNLRGMITNLCSLLEYCGVAPASVEVNIETNQK